MTLVQSLAAALLPVSASSPSLNQNGSARSFVDFLHSPVALAGGRQPQTYGFSALGMFGLGRVATMGESQSTEMQFTSAPVAPVRDTGEIVEGVRMALEGEAQAGVQPPIVAEATSLLLPAHLRAAPRDGRAVPLPSLAVPADAVSPPPMMIEGEAEPATEGAPARAFRGGPQGSAEAVPVHLLVSGSDGALQVVARSQDDTPEARLRLRRLIEDAVTEFGVKLGSLHINGSEAKHSFPSMVGGTHGDRAR